LPPEVSASPDEAESRKARPPSPLYGVAWLFYLGVAAAAVLWRLDENAAPVCEGSSPCLRLFIDPNHWPLDFGLGLLAAAFILIAWEITRRYWPLAAAMEEDLSARVGHLTSEEALAIALLSGFSEELFFRGAMQGSLGWLPATLVFAVLHTGPSRALRLWTVYAAVAGLAFSLLVVWRQNLLPPIVAHIVVNGIGLWKNSGRCAAAE